MSTNGNVTHWEMVTDRLFGKVRSHGISEKVLHVLWANDFLTFSVFPEGWEGGISEVRGGVNSIADLLQQYASALYSLSVGMSKGLYLKGEQKDSALLSLRARGAALFRRIIPQELQAEIRSWPDRTIFRISTNEHWIPWELMHDGRGFLGQRMLLLRMPRMPMALRERIGIGRPPWQSETSYGQQILNVVGGGLKKQAEECHGLFQDFGKRAHVRLLHETSVSALSRAIRDADLIHFTCHGHRDPLMLQIYETEESAMNLLVDSVAGDDFQIKPRCLVYANACNSATSELVFGEFVGFAWQFYTKGAAAFIGTLGPIPTRDALIFARKFYGRLANGEAGNIYSAYQATREEVFSEWPSCLLFCVYANDEVEPSFKALPGEAG